MKTQITLLIILTGIVACKNPKKEVKLSPETKLELSGFNSSWDATGQQLEQWGQRLKTNTEEIRHVDSSALKGVPANPPKNVKAMADSLERNHAEISVRLAILSDTYEKLVGKWKQRDSMYNKWEEDLHSGEIKEEQTKASLEPYKEFQHVVETALGGMEKELSMARQETIPLAVRLNKASQGK